MGVIGQGRVQTKGDRKYQIQNIWNQHHEIMRLSLVGWKGSEIARHLNISEAMVTYTLNSEIVRRQMSVMQGARDADSLDIAIELKRLAPICIAKLEEVLRDENSQARLRVDVAKDILDRAGYAAQRNLKVDVTGHLSEEDIERIKIRAAEAGILARPNGQAMKVEDVIEADYKEVKQG